MKGTSAWIILALLCITSVGLAQRKDSAINPPKLVQKTQIPPDERIPSGMKLIFSDDFERGNAKAWQPKPGNKWRVEDDNGNKAYRLIEPGEQGKVRAPGAYSLIKDSKVTNFVFTVKTKCMKEVGFRGRDMDIIFGYQDETHFYYVHFSNRSDSVHNAILIVNGKPRAPITIEKNPIARLDDQEYHLLKVERNVETGEIKAYIDDMKTPILTARDKTFTSGLVGVGSFDDIGYFDDVKLYARSDE